MRKELQTQIFRAADFKGIQSQRMVLRKLDLTGKQTQDMGRRERLLQFEVTGRMSRMDAFVRSIGNPLAFSRIEWLGPAGTFAGKPS